METRLETFFRYGLSFYAMLTLTQVAIAFFTGNYSDISFVFWQVTLPQIVFSTMLLAFLFFFDSDRGRRINSLKFGSGLLFLWLFVVWTYNLLFFDL